MSLAFEPTLVRGKEKAVLYRTALWLPELGSNQ